MVTKDEKLVQEILGNLAEVLDNQARALFQLHQEIRENAQALRAMLEESTQPKEPPRVQ